MWAYRSTVEELNHETDQQRRRTEWRSVRRLFPNRRPQQMAFCSAVAQQRFYSAFCWAAACSDDCLMHPSRPPRIVNYARRECEYFASAYLTTLA